MSAIVVPQYKLILENRKLSGSIIKANVVVYLNKHLMFLL